MKTNGFYQLNAEVLKFRVDKDAEKILFNHYIMQKENLQRLSDELPRGYFKLSSRSVADDLAISTMKANRLIKEFEELGIIKPIFKSKSKKESSVYCYVSVLNFGTVHGTVCDTVHGTVKCDNINGLSLSSGTVHGTVCDTVHGTSKKELYKKNYKKESIPLSLDKKIIETTKNVVTHLNNVANKKHQVDSETLTLVKQLLDNNYCEQDIKNVITVKTNQWLHDIKMNPNLRPKTLFSMEKFDTYLNEYASTQPQKDEIVGEIDSDLASFLASIYN